MCIVFVMYAAVDDDPGVFVFSFEVLIFENSDEPVDAAEIGLEHFYEFGDGGVVRFALGNDVPGLAFECFEFGCKAGKLVQQGLIYAIISQIWYEWGCGGEEVPDLCSEIGIAHAMVVAFGEAHLLHEIEHIFVGGKDLHAFGDFCGEFCKFVYDILFLGGRALGLCEAGCVAGIYFGDNGFGIGHGFGDALVGFPDVGIVI